MTPRRAEQVVADYAKMQRKHPSLLSQRDVQDESVLLGLITDALRTLQHDTIEACVTAVRDAIVEEYPGSDQSLERILAALRAAVGGKGGAP